MAGPLPSRMSPARMLTPRVAPRTGQPTPYITNDVIITPLGNLNPAGPANPTDTIAVCQNFGGCTINDPLVSMTLQQIIDLVTSVAATLPQGIMRVIASAKQLNLNATGDFPVPVTLPPGVPFVPMTAFAVNPSQEFVDTAQAVVYPTINQQGKLLFEFAPHWAEVTDAQQIPANGIMQSVIGDHLFITFLERASTVVTFDFYVLGFPLV